MGELPGTRQGLQRFQNRFSGEMLVPGDAGYDDARTVWNGRIDRYPALIACCERDADVVAALNLAREESLPLAVRGGGHNVAGTGVCDGGIVIDLSRMNAIAVGPVAGIARAGAGARWQELDRATQVYGLATPGGTHSEIGVAGLTLGGGTGWLMGKHGVTCDNLLSARVATADDQILTASADEHPDLFWGIRGGGGNVGVALSFEYRLHQIGPIVYAGTVSYAFEDAAPVLQEFGGLNHVLPDELIAHAALRRDGSGAPVVTLTACYSGPLDQAEVAVAPLRTLGTPIVDTLQPIPFLAWQSMMDATRPPGRHCAQRSHGVRALSDAAIDTLISSFLSAPSSRADITIEGWHGAIARVPIDAMAFSLRANSFQLSLSVSWDGPDPVSAEANVNWIRDAFAASSRFSSGEVYVNSLADGPDEAARIREAYGLNYARLAAIKQVYDAENLFRINQNIAPEPLESAGC